MTLYSVSSYSQPMLAKPSAIARQVSECVFGELLEPIREVDDFTEVRAQRDGYTGFVRTDALVPESRDGRLAFVAVRESILLAEPDEKSAVVTRLPVSAQLYTLDDAGQDSADKMKRFLKTSDGSYAIASHLGFEEVSNGTASEDLVRVAETLFSGAPYVWGGKSPAGCDCSGMLQSAARAIGIDLPRDSHQQEQAIATTIGFDKRQRGDIVFWPGHVGLLFSPELLLHANAYTMNCCIETLSPVITRAGAPGSIRRLRNGEK